MKTLKIIKKKDLIFKKEADEKFIYFSLKIKKPIKQLTAQQLVDLS